MRTIAWGLCLCLAAAADEVVLKAGGKVSGVAEERGTKVLVRTEHGVLTFDRSDVERIDRTKSSPLQEYQERLAKQGGKAGLPPTAQATPTQQQQQQQ